MALFGRKSRPVRRKVNQLAWMSVDDSFATRPCTIVDMSQHGARLKIDDSRFLKPMFRLHFERGMAGKACRVAWRKNDVVGVEFI
jgi:PilZ domain